MLNRLLSKNRVFMALVLALVFVASGLLYLNTVKRQATRDIQSTQERVNAPKPPPPDETAESGHFHADGTWHTVPHRHVEVPPNPVDPPNAQASESRTSKGSVPWIPGNVIPVPGAGAEWSYQALREMYSPADGNPPGFNVPEVNLWDFQETKAAYESNLAFYMANWKPNMEDKEYTPELITAGRIMHEINRAADRLLGIFTPEECEQIRELNWQLSDFMGIEPPRYRQLMAAGYTKSEALDIDTHEILRKKGYSEEKLFSLYPDTRKLMERYWHQIGRPSNEDR